MTIDCHGEESVEQVRSMQYGQVACRGCGDNSVCALLNSLPGQIKLQGWKWKENTAILQKKPMED